MYEVYRELEHGTFDVSSNIHFVSRRPTSLQDYGAMARLCVIVENWSGQKWGAWRCALHQVAILRDKPSTLMIYDPIVLDEVLLPEKESEVIISIHGSKCSSDESVDEEVAG